MLEIFSKIKQYFSSSNNKCKHPNKTEVWREYPDAYIEYKCDDCGEHIFEDMYSS